MKKVIKKKVGETDETTSKVSKASTSRKKIKHEMLKHDVTMETEGLTGVVDVDDLTSIHIGNIEGEVLTIVEQLNKVGFLKSLAEREAKKSKLKLEVYSAEFSKNLRREAAMNSNYFTIDGDRVKLTENSAKEALILDPTYQKLAKERIDDETNFEMASILYWSVSEKSKKLDRLVHRPQE